MAKSIDINDKDHNGTTPLHCKGFLLMNRKILKTWVNGNVDVIHNEEQNCKILLH